MQVTIMETDRSPNRDFIPALGYHWMTGLYDLVIRLTMPEQKFRLKLVEEVNPQPGETILEFGFGTGANLLHLLSAQGQADVRGLDIDPKVRAIALQKLEKAGLKPELDLYDGGTFPYADHSFDKVYSCLVFHQLDAVTKTHCFQEICRVLKPGGTMIISDWGKPKTKSMRIAFYAVQLLDGFKTTADNVNGLLPKYMERAGFLDVVESGFIPTCIGSLSYYRSGKPS